MAGIVDNANGTAAASHGVNGPRPSPSTGPGVDTDFLVVGGGPAGASLACFLATYGNSWGGRRRQRAGCWG